MLDKAPINPEEMRCEIARYYDAGDYSDKLDRMVWSIVEGYVSCKRIRHYYGDAIADDIQSTAHLNASMSILNKKLDLEYNPHSYVTRIAATTAAREIKKANEKAADLAKYAASMIDYCTNCNEKGEY